MFSINRHKAFLFITWPNEQIEIVGFSELNITRYNKVSELDLSPYPALSHVVDRQIVAWPEHEPTIATSLGKIIWK